MSSREVESEGSNFCGSRANTNQAPAPFRDVTKRQKQAPIQASRESGTVSPCTHLPANPSHSPPRCTQGRVFPWRLLPEQHVFGEHQPPGTGGSTGQAVRGRGGPRAPGAPAGYRDTTWVQHGLRASVEPQPRGAPGTHVALPVIGEDAKWDRALRLRRGPRSGTAHPIPRPAASPAARARPSVTCPLCACSSRAARAKPPRSRCWWMRASSSRPPPPSAAMARPACRAGQTPLPLPPRGPMGSVVPGTAREGARRAGVCHPCGSVTPPRGDRGRKKEGITPWGLSCRPGGNGENGRAEGDSPHEVLSHPGDGGQRKAGDTSPWSLHGGPAYRSGRGWVSRKRVGTPWRLPPPPWRGMEEKGKQGGHPMAGAGPLAPPGPAESAGGRMSRSPAGVARRGLLQQHHM